jgi:hypothetical protein
MMQRNGTSEGASESLWRHTLLQIPSVFGRLVYLASLRDSATGKYEHHGLALVFGVADAARALRRSHAQTFQEWLSFNLEQQKADLDLYLSAVLENKRLIIENWVAEKAYRNYMPSSASTIERRLYKADMEALVDLLKNEFGVAGPGRDA